MSGSMFRRIKRLLKNSDQCSLCRTPFAHNSKTYGGITYDRAVAIVGDCCIDQMKELHGCGLFVHGQYSLAGGKPKPDSRYSVEDAVKSVSALQTVIDYVDEESGRVLKMAGANNLAARPAFNFLAQSDDADWFKEHPDRTHHARSPTAEEVQTLEDPAPAGHELTILLRQIEPGRRLRMGFFKPLDLPLPDDEALVHALADVVIGGRPGGNISRQELMLLWEQYRQS
jgi:hypothetical protein